MSSVSLAARLAQLTTSQRTILADRINRQNSSLPARQQLYAWFTTDCDATDLSTDCLQADLAELLPPRMRPDCLLQVNRLPRTSSGKLDRRRLVDCTPATPAVPAAFRQPAQPGNENHPQQERIREIWHQVLGRSVADDADFFSCGGDSLDVIRVLAMMSEAGLRMTPSQFAEHPTLAAQAQWLNCLQDPLAASPTVPGRNPHPENQPPSPAHTEDSPRGNMIYLSEQNARPPLFFLPPKCRAASVFEHIVRQVRNHTCYCPVLMSDDTEDTTVVEDVVPEFLDQIRKIQPQGPYRLVGNCEGAFVAWELARRLTAAGERVDFVGILDTPNPQGFREKHLRQRIASRLQGVHPLRLVSQMPALAVRLWKWARRQQRVQATGDVSLNRPGTHMGWAFQPQPYDGHVSLFRCTKAGTSDFSDLEIDDLHGWGGPSERLQLVSVPISRDDLFERQTGALLAAEIEAALDRVRTLSAHQ
ncbi:MAG: thioesterase domain-containing protein [Planctomycetaceae bacterium]|nr:thioesterase domain-containing protein [Planctomycetaceae bacterium]